MDSEYERAWNWKEKQNQVYFEKASDGMIELLDLTLNYFVVKYKVWKRF